jgi:hypothetical protein
MASPFTDLVRQAAAENTCVKVGCTTCGAGRFRSELRRLNEQSPHGLCTALWSVQLQEVVALPDWGDCLRWALHELEQVSPDDVDRLLTAWGENPNVPTCFLDWILYYVVRPMSSNRPVRAAWIKRCLVAATTTQNESLIESLIWTLGKNLVGLPEFYRLASASAVESQPVTLALRKTLMPKRDDAGNGSSMP